MQVSNTMGFEPWTLKIRYTAQSWSWWCPGLQPPLNGNQCILWLLRLPLGSPQCDASGSPPFCICVRGMGLGFSGRGCCHPHHLVVLIHPSIPPTSCLPHPNNICQSVLPTCHLFSAEAQCQHFSLSKVCKRALQHVYNTQIHSYRQQRGLQDQAHNFLLLSNSSSWDMYTTGNNLSGPGNQVIGS